MTTQREHLSGAAKATRLAAQLSAGAVSLSVTSGGLSTWPDGSVGRIPVVVNRGLPDEEHLYATAASGDTLTGLVRGQDDTVDQTHTAGATVEHGLFAAHIDAANKFLSSPTGADQFAISSGAGEWSAGPLPAGIALPSPTIADLTNAPHHHGSPGSGGFLQSAAPTNSAVGDAAAIGVSVGYSRADHRHGMPSFGLPGTSVPGDDPAAGAATTVARADHQHGREDFPAAVTTLPTQGNPGTVGAASTVARGDHTHTVPATGFGTAVRLPLTTATGQGVATTPARADHTHGLPEQVGVQAVSIVASNAGTASVPFPAQFAAAPVLKLTVEVGGNLDLHVNITARSATGFSMRVFSNSGAAFTANAAVHWAAVGNLG